MYFNLDNFIDIRGSVAIPTRGEKNKLVCCGTSGTKLFANETTIPGMTAKPSGLLRKLDSA